MRLTVAHSKSSCMAAASSANGQAVKMDVMVDGRIGRVTEKSLEVR